MKILTIIGSPRRKGNSYQAARQVEEEMKKRGNYEFEYLFLKDTDLQACRGCFNCVSRGIEFCPLKDDRQMIQDKMAEADGLVLVSPVYVMTVSALLKNFIDRVAYLCHRPEYHGKKALVLCTTGGVGGKETLDYMEKITEAWGYQVNGKCSLSTAPWPATPGLQKKNKKTLDKSVQRFDQSLKSAEKERSGKIKVKIMDYVSFRIFQTISGEVRDYMPADYQFYQGKEYYQPARIGLLTRAVTGILLKVIFFMMRDMGPGEEKNK
ncbi:flavodoxin family protein [Methanobacterium sp. BAmetb5]|uniref:flavodoxin family protein n=1 Tax=Methanobacterium sp. BAmetb5 TaxID=2025351 RepID=UPI000E8063C3|nr:NAD(P)H-dependent oxidoreductase [Methanobacterium sp. BAmetb5]AXV40381.1 MAG: NADPH-dependent FMN reductase [Methanobacterium sp. BAmetb5]